MFTKALLPDTLRAVQLVSGIAEIRDAYLAGGSALALQIGHRISVDLDFFTQQEFSEDQLAAKLASLTGFAADGTAHWTVWGRIGQTRFSMFCYKYPLLEKTLAFQGIQLASLPDIAAMKINAIEKRGTRRYFIDIYFLSKTFSLEDMLGFYQQKYAVLEEHLYSVLRSLDYFEDAEQESQMPRMLRRANWEEVKEYFRKETGQLIKTKLQA